MSENSWQKSYDEYFKNLEKQLEKGQNSTASQISVRSNYVKKQSKKSKGIYRVFRIRKGFIVAVLVLVFSIVAIAAIPTKTKKEETKPQSDIKTETEVEQTVEDVTEISYSSNQATVSIPASNDAKTAIIVNKTNNTIVAQRNAHQRTYPASTTKIMTLLIAVENLKDLNQTFTMSYEITDPLFTAEASVAGFLNGEEVSATDLLYGTILPSGADAAMGLAILVAGSEKDFVKLMNKKVKQLGLENTHFNNVTGLHHKENYSSAYDMAVILDAALQNELCKTILSTYQYTTAKTPQNPEGILLSSTLFSYMYGTEPETATILGGKTGFVNESGYCIASYGKANQNGNEYIVITLGNSARWPAFYGQIDLYKEFVN